MSQIVQQHVRGRYAPSPTGDLHLGNLRTALLAWLFARSADGQFVLRIEDLDSPRVRLGATQRMINDLRWLGLDWDEGPDCDGPYAPYTQSERLEIYQHYLQRLQEAELLYPCYCSRAEIAHAASAPQQGVGDGSRYPGTCRQLTQVQRRRHEANGRRPSLRLHVDDERIISFTDLIAGSICQHVQQEVGDFIIRRSDGIFGYQFTVVVDDGLMCINQIMRGADLLHSTARQILLFETLGFPIPTFAHAPLLLDEEGKRLSKRTQSMGLEPIRKANMTPADVIGQLAASCGLVEKGTSIGTTELAEKYHQQPYAIIASKLHSSQQSIATINQL
jgi:glutamyl-tRNA synthetase